MRIRFRVQYRFPSHHSKHCQSLNLPQCPYQTRLQNLNRHSRNLLHNFLVPLLPEKGYLALEDPKTIEEHSNHPSSGSKCPPGCAESAFPQTMLIKWARCNFFSTVFEQGGRSAQSTFFTFDIGFS